MTGTAEQVNELAYYAVTHHPAAPSRTRSRAMVNAYRDIRPQLARAVSVNPGLFA